MNEKSASPYSHSFHNLLEQAVKDGLENLIGKSASESVLINFKLLDQLDHPSEFHKTLFPVFKQGTPTLEKAIIKELFQKMGEPYDKLTNMSFDYEVYISFAKKLFEERKASRY